MSFYERIPCFSSNEQVSENLCISFLGFHVNVPNPDPGSMG